jgi:PPOX class probable F420-dependent enzyme
VRRNLAVDDLGDLLDRPIVAVLATYRRDGSVLLSPVWHEWRNGGFNVVTSRGDIKARHLGRDARASIVVCEDEPPYRGVEVRSTARLLADDVRETVRRLAVRYLGKADGDAYAASSTDDTLIRLEPGELRGWDFSDWWTT